MTSSIFHRFAVNSTLVLFVWGLAGQLPQVAAQVGFEPDIRFHESVTLDTDNTVVKKLGTVHDYLAERDWSQAVEILQQITATHGDGLIAAGPGRYLNVARYCQIELSRLPAEGLAHYRERVDAEASQWFVAGASQQDPLALRRVVQEAFACSKGDDALWLLGERALESGHVSLARRYWEQLIPASSTDTSPLILRYPDSDIDRALILARLILCSILEKDLPRAELELAAFQQLHPQATGRLAGREGDLAEILAELIESATHWPLLPGDGAPSSFAGNQRRNHVAAAGVDVGPVLWSASLPEKRYMATSSRPALRKEQPLSYFPVVVDGLALVNNADSVYAYNLQTGKPAWPLNDTDNAAIYPPGPNDRERLLSRAAVGTPQYTMTIESGRLFARMGPPVTHHARHEFNAESELICLDLRFGQGKLLWRVTAAEFHQPIPDEELSAWSFAGTPVVSGERVYVAMIRSHTNAQTNLTCFNASDGSLIWNRKLCASAANIDETRNQLGHRLLTLADDTLFYSTGTGAIAAADTRDGRLKWVVTYASRAATATVETPPPRDGLAPCLYHQGLVIAAPVDDNAITAIDAATGLIQWRQPLRDQVRHLLGAESGVLIASGNSLWAIDIRSGDILWNLGYEDPAGYGYGRGVMTRDAVYWPLHDEIFVVQPTTGTLLRRIPLARQYGESGGNLVIADGKLLLAQPQRLVVFGEHETLPVAQLGPDESETSND